ncbi:MAG: acyltransferase 3 [Lacunisphaera sp.]|nr:acyltransferase 3 [Lacunisphaera sp.]
MHRVQRIVPDQSRGADEASAAYRAFKQTKIFGSLDGLRAISILAVIWFHTVPLDRRTLLGQGNQGVTLFFAISGFLIVTLLLRSKEATGAFSLPRFWGRRMLRIFPVYYAVLALYGVLVWKFERDGAAREAFFANVPAFATFTSNWFVDLEGPRVIFYFAWSLAAEEQFYLVWPLVERLGRGAWPLGIALGAAIATQVVLVVVGVEAARNEVGLRMLTSVPTAILCGVALAHLLHRPATYRQLWQIAGRRGSGGVAVALSVAALACAPHLGAPGDLLSSLALAFLVATCVVREDNDLAVVLRWRWVAWIGTVSYGMYLLHMIAVNAVRRAGAMAGIESPYYDFVAGVAASLALASISYLTYERFFLKLKNSWFGVERAPKRAISAPALAAAGP